MQVLEWMQLHEQTLKFGFVYVTTFLLFLNAMNGNRYLFSLSSFGGTIPIKDEIPKVAREGMPFSKQDAHDTLEVIQSFQPEAIKGVKLVQFVMRPENLPTNVLGTYSATTKVVSLYPMKYDRAADLYYLTVEDHEILYTKEEAYHQYKHTLAHEFGHNFFFKTENRLTDDQTEMDCDKFAEAVHGYRSPLTAGRLSYTPAGKRTKKAST